MAIDPYRSRDLIKNTAGNVVDAFWFSLPVLLWLDSGFMILLYWLELQRHSGIKALRNISKTRIMLVGFAIATAAIYIILGSLAFGTLISIAYYNVFLILVCMSLLIFSLGLTWR